MMKQYQLLSKIWGLLLVAIFMSSCGTKNEGCTDANAANFDVSADENCCCSYPKMGIKFNYLFDDTIVSGSNPVLDANGDEINFSKLIFYVSDIHWVLDNGTEKRSDKRVWLYTNPMNLKDSVRSIDDYYFATLSGNALQDYTFYEPFNLKSLRFTIGVADSALNNQPNLMKNASHPLAAKSDSMYDYVSKHYLTMKLGINQIGDTPADTYIINASEFRQVFEFPLNYKTVLGFDNNILINVYMDRIVDGISFRNDDKNVIRQRLVENLKNIFTP